MSGFKNYLRDFLTYTRTEKRGIILLLALILTGLIALFVLDFLHVGRQQDFTKFNAEVDSFYAQLAKDSAAAFNNQPLVANKNETLLTPAFLFNPNNLPDSLWMKLGLSEKQIAVIKNYEQKGGRFRTKEDVKKMYVISDEMFSRIEPYINIPEVKSKNFDTATTKKSIAQLDTVKKQTKSYNSLLFPIDINTASTIELEMLPGIGSSRAKSIFNYKIMLGGYTSIEQLKEVYGMVDSVYDVIKEKVTVKSGFKPVQLNINAEKREQLKHPYIPYKLAEIIVNNRKTNGNYATIDDIKTLPLMKAEIFSKIKPYLKVE